MNKAIIKLAYKQIITAASGNTFERDVFTDTYQEFLMQAQAYNPENKLKTFQEIVAANPKANALQYKVGFAIGLYINDLKNIVPNVTDALGRSVLSFQSYRFELIESDIINKANHKVSLTYFTGTLILLACIGEYLLLTADHKANETASVEVETFMIKMQPGLSIVAYQELQ